MRIEVAWGSCSAWARISAAHPSGAGAIVSYEDRLRRTLDSIYPNPAEHLPFGLLHEDVAGPEYLVYGWDRCGTEGQGGDGLGPAQLEHLVHLGDVGGGQHDR